MAHEMEPPQTENEADRPRAQKFFATIAAESRRPSFGEMQAGWTKALLARAQEAQLYDPTKEPA